MVKPLSPTANNPVRTLEEESRLNIILLLVDHAGERLTLDVVLRYGFCKLVIAPSFCCNVLLQCLLTEKWQLRWIYRLLVVDWVCYRVTGSWLYTCTYGRAIYWILLSFFIFVTNWNLNWTISLHDSCIKYYGIWGESLYKQQFLIRLHSESNNNIYIKIRTFELTTDIDLVQVELRTDTDLIPARFLLEFYPF